MANQRKQGRQDRLDEAELQVRPFYEPGRPYLWTMGFGWGFVGFFVRMESPLEIRVAHANYFRQAHMTWGRLARTGGSEQTTWVYVGDKLLNRTMVLSADLFLGDVPRGPVREG